MSMKWHDATVAGTPEVSTIVQAGDNRPVTSSAVKSAITKVETDLASIHATGTTNTTGAAITAGTYFYMNGALVRAIADIDVNAPFTSGTNYETVTAGGLNDLSRKTYKVSFTLPSSTGFFTVPSSAYPSFAQRNNTMVLATAYLNSDNNIVYASPSTDYNMIHFTYGNLLNANLASKTAIMICASNIF